MSLRDLLKAASSRPWKYDWGNWEVESAKPDRYPIGMMTPDARRAPFHGQAPNPVDSGTDGELIAGAVNSLEALLDIRDAAEACMAAQAAWDDYENESGVEHGFNQKVFTALVRKRDAAQEHLRKTMEAARVD